MEWRTAGFEERSCARQVSAMIRARLGATEFVQTVLRLLSNAKEFAFIGRGGLGAHRSFHRTVLMMYCDDPGVRLAVFLSELKEPGYLARR
jgi:hypothetical protein